MNSETSQYLKKYGLTVLIFMVLILILAGIDVLTHSRATESIRKSAENTILSWNPKAPIPGKMIIPTNAGSAYQYTFEATSGKSKKDLVFVIRITGRAGPHTGIFLYTPEAGTEFCGLADQGNTSLTPAQLGISDFIIASWNERISTIAKGME